MGGTYALILAGGSDKAAGLINRLLYNERFIEGYKAIKHVNGKFVVQYVIDAFSSSGIIGGIYIVAPEKVKFLDPQIKMAVDLSVDEILKKYTKLVPEKESFARNLYNGLNELIKDKNPDKIIISSCDIPRITNRNIENFIGSCDKDHEKTDADFYVGWIDKEAIKQRGIFKWRPTIKLNDGSRLRVVNYVVFYPNEMTADLIDRIANVKDEEARKCLENTDKIYSFRKALNPVNALNLCKTVLREDDGFKAGLNGAKLAYDLWFSGNRGFDEFENVGIRFVSGTTSLGLKVRFIKTDDVEASEDLDSERDFRKAYEVMDHTN